MVRVFILYVDVHFNFYDDCHPTLYCRKVCRPFAPNMTRFWMRIFLLVSVIVSFTLSVPTAISYESVEVLNTEMNIIGFSCKKIQNEEDTGFLFYGFLVVAMMIFILSLLVFLYGRIIYTLHKHSPEMTYLYRLY